MSSSQDTLVVGLATLNSPAFQESLQGAEVARMTAVALFALAGNCLRHYELRIDLDYWTLD